MMICHIRVWRDDIDVYGDVFYLIQESQMIISDQIIEIEVQNLTDKKTGLRRF